VAEDLAGYLDSWAELLAANVERRVQEAAAQSQAESERLAQTLEAARAALAVDLGAARSDIGALAHQVSGVSEGLAGTGQRVDTGLSAVVDRLAGVDKRVGTVDDHVAEARQDLEYTGSEVARANATLESLQSAIADLHEALAKLPNSINTALNRDLAGDLAVAQQEREATEFAALDDLLALLDGLEIELDAGRQLLLAIAAAQREPPPAPTGLRGAVANTFQSLANSFGAPEPFTAAPPPADAVQRLVDGIQTTHRRVQDARTRRGVTPIEAVGARFDPNFHEAVAFEPCPPAQNGRVLREQRRGYRTPDAVVRMAHVVVGRTE
jgi:molecular chaperone GrpE